MLNIVSISYQILCILDEDLKLNKIIFQKVVTAPKLANCVSLYLLQG